MTGADLALAALARSCVPSKALIRCARAIRESRRAAEFGAHGSASSRPLRSRSETRSPMTCRRIPQIDAGRPLLVMFRIFWLELRL
eukprot:6193727-Pleurochrysis_carterae.AAC.2